MGDGDAEQVRQHLSPHAPQVGGPCAQVLVLEAVPRLRGPLDHPVPGLCRGTALIDDRSSGRGQQGVVLQEEEVRVEDLRLIHARAPRDPRPLARDLVADLAERGIERGDLDVGAGRSLGDR